MIQRIDKTYYRAHAPGLRLWWPLSRERRVWRAAFIHRERYREHMLVRALCEMMEMEVGETRGGVTLLAKAGGES